MGRKLLLLALCAGCALAGPSVGRSEDGAVSVAVTPAEVGLTPGGSSTGVLVIANAAQTAATDLHVKGFGANPSVAAKVQSISPDDVPAGGSVAVRFKVCRKSEGSGQDVNVRFVVTYSQKPNPKSPAAVVRVAVAAVTVKAASSLALVEAKIESKVETVNENRPGEAALLVTNPRESTVHVRSLVVSAPNAVAVTLTCPKPEERLVTPAGSTKAFTACAIALRPQSQEVLHLDLEPNESVAPGSRTVLIKVEAARTPNGPTVSTVATFPFTVDVFAESDILKSIGVPIFLLLPGVIILLASWFLIRRASPWRRLAGDANLGTPVEAATFTAVCALGVSLLVAALYPSLTDRLVPGDRRDYLKAYGFRDFYYVVGYGFAIAGALWVLAWFLSILIPLVRRLFVPSPNDDPCALLRKLGLRGIFNGRTTYPRVSVAVDGADPVQGIDLGARRKGQALIAPVIVATLSGSGAADRVAKIQTKAAEGRAFGLWRELRKAKKKGNAQLAYKPGHIPSPRLVDPAKLAPTGQVVPIVEAQT